MITRSTIAIAALLFAGCNPTEPETVLPDHVLPLGPQALVDAGHATGSTPIAATGDFVYGVNPDAATVSRVDPETGAIVEIDVGTEPSRVAVANGSVYVSLRGERSVVRLDEAAFGQGVQQREVVGAEPVGLVAREDGKRVYVALSQENTIVELDGDTLEPLRTFEIPGEPRYLALHPSGGSLYVGSGRGEARLTRISLQTGQTQDLELPTTMRFGMEGEIDLVPRITGDLWVTPDGERVLVPVLYADNESPVADVSVEPGEPVPPIEPGLEGYGGGGDGVDKFTPSVVEIPVGAEGQPEEGDRALFVSTTVFPPNNNFSGLTVGSYITSVTSSPDGETYLVTMEGSRSAMLIDPDAQVFGMMFDAMPASEDSDGLFDPFFTMPEDAGFFPPALATVVAGDGANGAMFDNSGRAFVHNAFDDTIGELPLAEAEGILEMHGQSMANFGEFTQQARTWRVSDSPLHTQIRNGRRLFYAATDNQMGSGGISCSTCHFEGRNDGITWTFESGVRQTPSLAGVVSETAPVTWTEEVESVAREADITTRGRMGGEGLTQTQLAAIEAFVDWTRLPDTPEQGRIDTSVMRGQAIFERSDVGCAACHSGDRFTDNQGHTIRGVPNLNTPGLQGIAGSAPYLHDGSKDTLREVLEWARSGEMGNTSMLSESEMLDLEAYLKSL